MAVGQRQRFLGPCGFTACSDLPVLPSGLLGASLDPPMYPPVLVVSLGSPVCPPVPLVSLLIPPRALRCPLVSLGSYSGMAIVQCGPRPLRPLSWCLAVRCPFALQFSYSACMYTYITAAIL
jgi:hypothetical protein